MAPRFPDAALLLLFAARHYGYQFWPQGQWGIVYGMAGACCLLALLALSGLWWPIKAWAMGEELLTAGCSAAWMSWPEWFVHAFADEKCSQAVGFKLGSIGLVFLALVVWQFTRTTKIGSYSNRDES